jgi:predicted GNAT family N-acyltransferase
MVHCFDCIADTHFIWSITMTTDSSRNNRHKTSQPIFEWVEPIKVPLINKFYKEYNIRGQAKKCDIICCIKVEQTIVGVALLRQILNHHQALVAHSQTNQVSDLQTPSNFLLTGVGVAPHYRGRGYSKLLINNMLLGYREHLCDTPDSPSDVYCFAYQHLQPLYESLGFCEYRPTDLPNALYSKWTSYLAQGRSLTCMKYRLG